MADYIVLTAIYKILWCVRCNLFWEKHQSNISTLRSIKPLPKLVPFQNSEFSQVLPITNYLPNYNLSFSWVRSRNILFGSIHSLYWADDGMNNIVSKFKIWVNIGKTKHGVQCIYLSHKINVTQLHSQFQ